MVNPLLAAAIRKGESRLLKSCHMTCDSALGNPLPDLWIAFVFLCLGCVRIGRQAGLVVGRKIALSVGKSCSRHRSPRVASRSDAGCYRATGLRSSGVSDSTSRTCG